MSKNVLLVWDRMGDYHRARWSALQKEFPDGKIYAADLGGSDHLYGWKNTLQQSNYFQLSKRNASSFDVNRIFRFIKILFNYNITTVCIAGYGRPEYIFFIIYGWLTRRKVILFAESWYPGKPLFDWCKSSFLRLTCSGFLVSGKRAHDHFIHKLHINPLKVKAGYSVVDNEHFSKNEGSVIRQKKIMLCVARFVEDKNLALLIHAFKSSKLQANGWQLKLMGGGPLKSSLEALAGGANIQFVEWQSYDELPAIYQSSSVFILPSIFEPWGLAVNEAMAAELPLILSNEVGCLPDLLTKGNGWSFDAKSLDSLITVFNHINDLSFSDLETKGKSSKFIIEQYSVSLFTASLKRLILQHGK